MATGASRMDVRVTACLIVRDEQQSLPACLESVRRVVDEIVVCDTGSSDETIKIAKAAGARLVHHHWRDHFSEARNAALAACTGDWVLSLDADETWEGRPLWFRATLLHSGPAVDAYAVQIDNAGAADVRGVRSHHEVKVFRRAGAVWTGRVHERLTGAAGAPLVVMTMPDEVMRLVHGGYDNPDLARDKASRNARLAQQALDELLRAEAPPDEVARAALDLGRSYLGCGQSEAAVTPLQLARALAGNGAVWAWATDFLARLALADARPGDALLLVAELEAGVGTTDYVSWLQALSLWQLGDLPAVQSLLEPVKHLVDLSGRPLDMRAVDELRAACSEAAAAG